MYNLGISKFFASFLCIQSKLYDEDGMPLKDIIKFISELRNEINLTYTLIIKKVNKYFVYSVFAYFFAILHVVGIPFMVILSR